MESCIALSWSFKCIKSFSHSPQGICFELSSAYFGVLILFRCSSIFWEAFNCFTLLLYYCSWYYSYKVTLEKKSLYSFSPSIGSYFEVFWSSFCGMSSIVESWSPSFLMKFYAEHFCMTLTVNVLRKISQDLSLCWWELCNIFGPILGIFLNVLRNVKHSLDFFHECLNITVAVTKLRKVLGLPLSWTFLFAFGSFCTISLK